MDADEMGAAPSQLSEIQDSPRARFRQLLTTPETVIVPGGFSPIYATMAERAGFQAFFVAGSQVSAFLYGVPDLGVIGLRDMAEHVRHVQSATSIPVLADADTGYGNAVNTYFAVKEFIRSGVAGMQIEDQEAPKKSGTSSGRRCISAAEAVGKIRAAVTARNEMDADFVIVARCDIIGAEGGTFQEALSRCVRYATEGGADIVWINSIQTLDQLAAVCAQVTVPVMTIWGGAQPPPSLADYQASGVKFVLYPVIAASAGLQAAWHVLNEFASRGPVALTEWGEAVHLGKWGKVELSSLVSGTAQIRDIENKMLPTELQRDYDSTHGHADVSFAHSRRSEP